MAGDRHAAVFGACIARQVFDFVRDGRGAPGDECMAAFIEEAEAIADMAERRWLDRTAAAMTPADRLRLAVQRSEELELRSAEATEFLADAIDRFNAAEAAKVRT